MGATPTTAEGRHGSLSLPAGGGGGGYLERLSLVRMKYISYSFEWIHETCTMDENNGIPLFHMLTM